MRKRTCFHLDLKWTVLGGNCLDPFCATKRSCLTQTLEVTESGEEGAQTVSQESLALRKSRCTGATLFAPNLKGFGSLGQTFAPLPNHFREFPIVGFQNLSDC